MTLTLELTPAEEARLAAAARLNGTEPALLIKQLVAEHLPLLDDKNGVFLDAQERERIARIIAAEGSFADDSWDVDPALEVPVYCCVKVEATRNYEQARFFSLVAATSIQQ